MTKQATARKTRNVVPFPGGKSSRKKSDRGLIMSCIIYARSVAAYDAGFEADPGGSKR
jgi:hypothetical protein